MSQCFSFSVNEVHLDQVGTPQCCMSAGWVSLWLKSGLTNEYRSQEFGCLYQIKEP